MLLLLLRVKLYVGEVLFDFVRVKHRIGREVFCQFIAVFFSQDHGRRMTVITDKCCKVDGNVTLVRFDSNRILCLVYELFTYFQL